MKNNRGQRSLQALLLLLSVAFACQSASAQNRPITYHIPHTTQKLVIDGVYSPDEWRDALKVELVNETFPGQNVSPPVNTDAYMMEDGENFLIVFLIILSSAFHYCC